MTCQFCEKQSICKVSNTELCETHLTVFLCHFPEVKIYIDSQWPTECYYCNNEWYGIDAKGRNLCKVCYDVYKFFKEDNRWKSPIEFNEDYAGYLRDSAEKISKYSEVIN